MEGCANKKGEHSQPPTVSSTLEEFLHPFFCLKDYRAAPLEKANGFPATWQGDLNGECYWLFFLVILIILESHL